MSFTQADIDALESAIGKGASSVKVGDEEVRFRSLSEMRQTLAMMKADVTGSKAAATPIYPRLLGARP